MTAKFSIVCLEQCDYNSCSRRTFGLILSSMKFFNKALVVFSIYFSKSKSIYDTSNDLLLWQFYAIFFLQVLNKNPMFYYICYSLPKKAAQETNDEWNVFYEQSFCLHNLWHLKHMNWILNMWPLTFRHFYAIFRIKENVKSGLNLSKKSLCYLKLNFRS